MNSSTKKSPVHRIPPSYYWARYWYSRQVGLIASLQLLTTALIISMEVGNAVVDTARSNVFSGFWSALSMSITILATFTSVCTTRTQTKAIVALICQVISIVAMLIVIGFLSAFIATDYTLCFAFQCSALSSTTFTTSEYVSLKRGFIGSEIFFSIINIVLSITYIYYFNECYKSLPRIHTVIPIERPMTTNTVIVTRRLSTMSKTSRAVSTKSQQSRILSTKSNRSRTLSTSSTNYNPSELCTYHQQRLPTPGPIQNTAQKVCPECQYVSLYIPDGNLLECPSCGHQSSLVEHSQQW